LNQQWQNIRIHRIERNPQKTLSFNIPEIEFLIKVHQDTPISFGSLSASMDKRGAISVLFG